MAISTEQSWHIAWGDLRDGVPDGLRH